MVTSYLPTGVPESWFEWLLSPYTSIYGFLPFAMFGLATLLLIYMRTRSLGSVLVVMCFMSGVLLKLVPPNDVLAPYLFGVNLVLLVLGVAVIIVKLFAGREVMS